MKRLIVFWAAGIMVTAWAADTTCYQLSEDGKMYSKTPELLCVEQDGRDVDVTLKTGIPTVNERNVAEFHLDLLSRVRCLDCNRDVLGVANPSNSVFNGMSIRFNGTRQDGEESGTVNIGKNLFYYRTYGRN